MTVWKIAGHKIPCTKCLGMDGEGNTRTHVKVRSAKHCYLPGRFICKKHWDFESKGGQISDWDFDNELGAELDRLNKEEERAYADVVVDPETERIITPIIMGLIREVFREEGLEDSQ